MSGQGVGPAYVTRDAWGFQHSWVPEVATGDLCAISMNDTAVRIRPQRQNVLYRYRRTAPWSRRDRWNVARYHVVVSVKSSRLHYPVIGCNNAVVYQARGNATRND